MRIGPFAVSLRSSLTGVVDALALLYSDYLLTEDSVFSDYRVEVDSPTWCRRYWHPQVNFRFDGLTPFKPLPANQAFAMFEWGLNWVVANHAHWFAVVHAAVVERDGRALLLPGRPGSGKSTLCAALVCRGWRLLSDEMALFALEGGRVWPIPRPISLKNASIDVIRDLAPDAVFGEVVAETAKGSLSHMRAPSASVEACLAPATIAAVVFPTFVAGGETVVSSVNKGLSLMTLAQNCFNYPVLGAEGFNCLANVVEKAECFNLSYSRLAEAFKVLEN